MPYTYLDIPSSFDSATIYVSKVIVFIHIDGVNADVNHDGAELDPVTHEELCMIACTHNNGNLPHKLGWVARLR